MKKILFLFFILMTFISCSNVSNDNNIDNNIDNDIDNNIDNNIDKGQKKIFTGNLFSKWYVPCDSEGLWEKYYEFKKDISSNKVTILGSGKKGDIKFLSADDYSKFEYKYEGGISGSEKIVEIILLDEDILINTGGLDGFNGAAYILYKENPLDIKNIPFVGLGCIEENNRSEWITFTPSGISYKRYRDLVTDELYIVTGEWEKVDDKTYKVYWNKNNKESYDLIKTDRIYQNYKIYQNYGENFTVLPMELQVIGF